MATKPSTKTGVKTKKPEGTAAKPDAVKAEGSTSESSKTETSASTSETVGAKKSSTPSREISYFSSVSNDRYRSGWDNIFSAGNKRPARKPGKPAASRLPARITLDADDLDAATREQLEAVFRRHARKKRLNYDKLSANGQVSWEISCRISSG